MDLERLVWVAERFRQFARQESGESPLYHALAEAVAADADLVRVAAEASAGQPVPNLFFGAVHYLLLKGQDGRLRRFYPSVGGTEPPGAEASDEFRRFVLPRREEIVGLMKSRRVQTNEVSRCAMLLPALATAAGMEGHRPLYLIEVGTSAGLLLLFDQYAYRYSDGQRLGAGDVRLACEVRGERRVPVPGAMPAVAGRVGVDLAPVDVADEDAALWLRSLVWPDQQDRAERLRAAIAVARRSDPVRLVCGEANDALPPLLSEPPPGAAACVIHCYTLNQFSPEARARFRAVLAGASAGDRHVYEVGVEGFQQDSRVTLGRYRGGGLENVWHLADNHAHGRWIRWAGEEIGRRRRGS